MATDFQKIFQLQCGNRNYDIMDNIPLKCVPAIIIDEKSMKDQKMTSYQT